MNKKIKNSLGLVILLASVVFLNACSDPEEKPKNVITDTDGITIDLKWSTGGNAETSISDSDLELYLYESATEIFDYSTNSYSFETISLGASEDNGTYTVAVDSYRVGKNTNYTITIDGVTASNSYTFNSSYSSGDTDHEIKVLTIVKSGSKFTITENN